MKLPKILDRFYKRVIKPVRCSKCNGFLYTDKERAAGISSRCANKIAAHKAKQEQETLDHTYFFTIPYSTKPSQYYTSLEACKADADKRLGTKIWCGSYDRPIPVMGFDTPTP